MYRLLLSIAILTSHPSGILFAQTMEMEPYSKIAFISDTQAPRWGETILLKEDQNEKATKLLLDDIVLQEPSALFIAGDVVNLSRRQSKWANMDTCLKIVQESGIPTYACLGNHELMGNAKKGEENFQSRFPDHVNTGYLVKKDSLAVIFLNSNFSKMKAEQIKKQDEWYKDMLRQLDTAQDVRAIIVSCHHSPYSDSKMVGCSPPVQEKFIPPYIESKKCRLFVTGHAHIFQHFKVQGKDFLIIGGGGGLSHPLKKSTCGQIDLAKDYKPKFQYITVSLFSDKLVIASRKLAVDFSGVSEGMRFDIKLAN